MTPAAQSEGSASTVALERAPTMAPNGGGDRNHRNSKSQTRAKLADKSNPDEGQPAQGEQHAKREHEQYWDKRREEEGQGEEHPEERDTRERGPNPEQRAKDSWRKPKDMIQKMVSRRIGRAGRTRTVGNVVTHLRARGRQSRNKRTEREPRAKRVREVPKLAPRKKEGPRTSEWKGIDTQHTGGGETDGAHRSRHERTCSRQRTYCKDNLRPRTPSANHGLDDTGRGITFNVEYEHRIGKRAGLHSADDLRVNANASVELKCGKTRIG